jgi:4-hydroxy-2-oxoheptanedioate aldolase
MGRKLNPLDSESLRARISQGQRLLGTVVASPDLALAEQLAACFDFLWIDLEHSPLTIRDVMSLCIASQGSGAGTLVRVPDTRSELVPALLDLGVDGLIAPRVDDAEVAARFAATMRYPPSGTRGFAHRRFTSFGLRATPTAEQAPLCFIQIESAASVERAEQIALVDGVDGLVVGPSDLALDLGVQSGLQTPELARAITAVQEAAARAGIVSGIAAGDSADVLVTALGASSTLLAYSNDMRIYASAIEAVASTMADAWRDNDVPAAKPRHT